MTMLFYLFLTKNYIIIIETSQEMILQNNVGIL